MAEYITEKKSATFIPIKKRFYLTRPAGYLFGNGKRKEILTNMSVGVVLIAVFHKKNHKNFFHNVI